MVSLWICFLASSVSGDATYCNMGCRNIISIMARAGPFSFFLPTTAVLPVVGYQLHGQPHGTCLRWEWRYFHYGLRSRDLKGWLKYSGHLILQKVPAGFSLPAFAIDWGRFCSVLGSHVVLELLASCSCMLQQ